MKIVLVILISALSLPASSSLPPYCTLRITREVIELPERTRESGSYLRAHPSGNYILYSDDDRTYILDISKKDKKGKIVPRIIDTPMKEESYPVQGDWRHITSPKHPELRFYSFEDLLKEGENAKPVYSDPEFTQYYHTAATLPGSTSTKATYRVLEEDRLKDYVFEFDGKGKVNKVTASKLQTLKFDTKHRASEVTTILSKDGTEVAASVRIENKQDPLNSYETTRIFKILENGMTREVEDLGFDTGKANFEFSYKGKGKGRIIFSGDYLHVFPTLGAPPYLDYWGEQIFEFDRDTRVLRRLSWPVIQDHKGYSADLRYPAYTQDGRVIYREWIGKTDDWSADSMVFVRVSIEPISQLTHAKSKKTVSNASLIALGRLYLDECMAKSDVLAPIELKHLALSQDPERCEKMVEATYSKWKKTKKVSSGLTKNDLLAACAGLAHNEMQVPARKPPSSH